MDIQENIGMSNPDEEEEEDDEGPYISIITKITRDTNVLDDFGCIPTTKKREIHGMEYTMVWVGVFNENICHYIEKSISNMVSVGNNYFKEDIKDLKVEVGEIKISIKSLSISIKYLVNKFGQ